MAGFLVDKFDTMKYKISLRNHLKGLEGILFLLFFLLISCICIYKFTNIYYPSIIRNFLWFWIISFIPVLYLHLEYYYYNKGKQIEIDVYSKLLACTDKTGLSRSYSFDELNKIVVYMPPNMYRGSHFQIMPFEQYHYAKIYCKSGEEIIITCLLAPKVLDMINNIKGVTVEKKKRIFASVLLR